MIVEQYCGPIDREAARDIPKLVLKDMYVTMLRIRLLEERVGELVAQKEIVCPCHLYVGQEAIAAGVCSTLRKEDYVYSTHRSHGHYIAKGGDIRTLMAELFGRATGCSRGNGGSMHLASPDIGFPGSSAIVAGTIPLAVGTALAFSIQGLDQVSVAFFGDGATTEGAFYESLNFAALKRLPVIFVCENNFYSTHMHIAAIQSNTDIYKRAEAFNVPAFRIDGNNAVEVFNIAKMAVENARAGTGPTFIECITYRWRGHVGPSWDVDKGLRRQEEVDWWVNNCSIKRVEDLLLSTGEVSTSELENIYNNLSLEIDKAIGLAKQSPLPDTVNFMANVFKAG